ncbi:MAG: FkbM family methyltransferase [Blautia sp.]|nr:FkbM family methyltransferase [Blautia sp.]MCM1222185.1 FkbM family methyltransferase [Lachnospiraceae bacterium]
MIEDFQNIYAHMGDKLSKAIYMDRLNYSITQDSNYLKNMVDMTVRNSVEWKRFCECLKEKSQNDKMYIFGAGIWGQILYKETKEFMRWGGIIDNQPEGKVIGDLDIVTLDQFMSRYDGNTVIVISSYKSGASMSAQLQKANIPSEKIIDGGNSIYRLTEGAIYFDLKELEPREAYEVFVDAGGFDGFTTKEFFRWCGGNGYSYCFDADTGNLDTLKDNLADYGNCEIIPKALWSESTVLSMRMTGNYASSVTGQKAGNDIQEIHAVALDDFIQEKKVTFIKMDIEGAELEAIKGAKRIIMEQRPRLAISIYHKAEDIWEIPQLLLKYYTGYKFYMRHYSFDGYDTVLYAIPE